MICSVGGGKEGFLSLRRLVKLVLYNNGVSDRTQLLKSRRGLMDVHVYALLLYMHVRLCTCLNIC